MDHRLTPKNRSYLTGLNYHYPSAAEAKANALIREAEALEVVA
jgi:hypothetical protein